ncbi:hypothetical protein CDAR_211461 [Caerostris darwini]|uniref:Uncharacterized protein n=1 Tax=Caerostris darwini TaxID=1538125 RepID=A0AAV4P1S7_9ARAC|nr:hypothetical protein CDAR_211461 [Caerostris darwini]
MSTRKNKARAKVTRARRVPFWMTPPPPILEEDDNSIPSSIIGHGFYFWGQDRPWPIWGPSFPYRKSSWNNYKHEGLLKCQTAPRRLRLVLTLVGWISGKYERLSILQSLVIVSIFEWDHSWFLWKPKESPSKESPL